MRIATASASAEEHEAVKEAWAVFSGNILSDQREQVEFLQYQVSAGISDIPLKLVDLMDRARLKAENLVLQLKRERAEADFYIGLQAGFQVIDASGPRRLAFLTSWAFVTDGLKGSFGQGPGIAVPSKIADPVIDRGIELNIVLDRITGPLDWRTNQGPWGVLTRDILNARHSFVLALIAAFSPFYNQEIFQS